MREIKFRSWIEKGQFMAIQGTPDLETLQSFIFHYGNNELEQYTGLKDKNGKEIYECDIIEADYGFGLVTFNKTTCSFEYDFEIDVDDLWVYAQKSEVIGNIYENPELLKND